MVRYYKNYRRRGNAAFFGILGGIFVVLGVLSFFFWVRAAAYAFAAFGVLLAVLPQFAVFARYWLDGDILRYTCCGLPRRFDVKELGAAIVCTYDEYRRGKGFRPATFALNGGTATVPALCLFTSIDEDELDLCDTRTAARMTFRKEHVADMCLDFDFLRQLHESGFSGKVYVSEFIYTMYEPAFGRIFSDGEIEVYDRIPRKVKKLLK